MSTCKRQDRKNSRVRIKAFDFGPPPASCDRRRRISSGSKRGGCLEVTGFEVHFPRALIPSEHPGIAQFPSDMSHDPQNDVIVYRSLGKV